MLSKHLTEYNRLRGNALHFTHKLNTNQYTESLVQYYVQRDEVCPCVKQLSSLRLVECCVQLLPLL